MFRFSHIYYLIDIWYNLLKYKGVKLVFDYFKDLSAIQSGYFYVALFSTVLFLLQAVFTFIDLGDHFELDHNFDGEVDGDFSDGFGLPFHLFTIRGIIGFFMLFGWSGFLFSKNDMNFLGTFIISFLCGFIMMLIIALIYYFADKLGESGNVELSSAIGREGEVYIPIPGENSGTGKISIILNNSLKELDAVTYHETLKSGEVVKVTKILNDKLVVEKVSQGDGE